MIFVQPFYDKFWTILSYTHIMFSLSLPLPPSLLFLTKKKREKESCHQMIVQIPLLMQIYTKNVVFHNLLSLFP